MDYQVFFETFMHQNYDILLTTVEQTLLGQEIPSFHTKQQKKKLGEMKKLRENSQNFIENFLVADMQLYERLCPSFYPSIGPLVRWSVGRV